MPRILTKVIDVCHRHIPEALAGSGEVSICVIHKAVKYDFLGMSMHEHSLIVLATDLDSEDKKWGSKSFGSLLRFAKGVLLGKSCGQLVGKLMQIMRGLFE